MVFSLLRCLTELEKPSQDNAEYINSGIGSGPSIVTSGPPLLGITMNSRLGTESSAKVFSFVDSSNSSRVKSDRGHHNRGVAPEGTTRAATDRPVEDRKHPLYRCSGRTYLGNRLSPSSWPIDSQDRWRDRTELESNPPTSQHARRQGDSSLAEPTATIKPRFRWKEKSSNGLSPETEIRSRLAREVEVLRRCTDWLQRLERGENMVVNLRPDEDIETEICCFRPAAGGPRAGTNRSRPG